MCESNNSVEAAMHVAPLELSDNRRQQQIEAALCELQFTMETVKKIGRVFESELEKGIHEEPSSLQMENTYIPELPDGTEKGKFLALDLGGTNFRVILLELDDGKVTDEKVKHYHLDDELKVGCGDRLFGFLAECISDFVKEQNLTGARLPLGFTFSFPMIQKALDVGILVTWTKTFNCPSVVGKDAVQMLKDAIHRRGDTHVEVLAVLNDTTGTLVQGAVLDNRTAIGLILGTGSNACYLERADRVQHWEGQRHGEKQVIIDIEWGAFGDNGVLDFIKTDYDREVDKNSLLATSFTFEKYISGKYLGEIVRVILVRLTANGLLFDGIASKKLLSQNSFPTSYVSQIEQDTVDGGNKNTEDILDKFNLQYTTEDTAVVKYVCEVVSNRSALLVSICLSRLLIRMDRPDTTIAVDGSLFKHHPRLKTWMNKYIQLLAPGKKFRLLLAEDGSGKGAGIVAAIALRLKERFQET
ncbi:hexokinase-1-like [Schistocerca piceifrons]|uniref:hexokinase-1-like n=1 Tax=Schistocerca piceifrons TaxID=274613 RepID=UPI001F5F76DB|nr:hexokinase-1-like [Schistocerca piceifrons]